MTWTRNNNCRVKKNSKIKLSKRVKISKPQHDKLSDKILIIKSKYILPLNLTLPFLSAVYRALTGYFSEFIGNTLHL